VRSSRCRCRPVMAASWLIAVGSGHSTIQSHCPTAAHYPRRCRCLHYRASERRSPARPSWWLTRIGVMRALNRHVERVFDSSRKDKHWGKRKLKRDTI
jgi:hypothetical protein